MVARVRCFPYFARVIRAKVIRPLSIAFATLVVAAGAPGRGHAIAFAESDLFAGITVQSIENLTDPGNLSGISLDFRRSDPFFELGNVDCFVASPCSRGPASQETNVLENAVTAEARLRLEVFSPGLISGGFLLPWSIGAAVRYGGSDDIEVTFLVTVDADVTAGVASNTVGSSAADIFVNGSGDFIFPGDALFFSANPTAEAQSTGPRFATDSFQFQERLTFLLGEPGFDPPVSDEVSISLVFNTMSVAAEVVSIPVPPFVPVPALALLLFAIARRRSTG